METIALLGATGSLGRALGGQLGEQGRTYRATSRSELGLKVRIAPNPQAEPCLWDSTDPGSIAAVLQGIDTAIYLVGMPVWEFEKHLALTRMVLDAAANSGLKRLVLVSSTWAYGLPQSGRIAESHPLAAHTAKGRVRLEQEQLVLAAHARSGLETTVLRVADFYGPYVEASYLWSTFRAAKNGLHAQLLPPIDRPREFAYVPDVARTILAMLETPEVCGRAWNLGGVAVTTQKAMADAIFAAAGRPVNYEIAPAWKMRIVALMNPYVREMREMQYLLDSPVLLDDAALSLALGGLHKTPYAEGIEETLQTVRIARR